MVSRRKMVISLGIVAVSMLSLMVTSWAGARVGQEDLYPREKTLITSGTQWGNIAGTNPYVGNYATGMVGLVNETLLRYDPLKDKYINWLAKSGKFTGAKTYKVVLRDGVKWSDGTKFEPRDVAWNFNIGRFKTAFWNNLWKNLASIKTPVTTKTVVVKNKKGKVVKVRKGGKLVAKKKKVKVKNTVVFTFKDTPNYIQWQNLIWNLPMISRRQGAARIQSETAVTTYSPSNPVGTGPYRLEQLDATTRVVWVKKASWWAAKQKVAPSPKPQFVVDLVNSNNTTAAEGLLLDRNDLNNNFIPGIETYVGQGAVQTYFKAAPYNLSANVAWLTPNTTHKPLDDKAFRKALAMAINVDNIVTADYHQLVKKSNAVGLLPTFSSWVNADANSKGFKYDVAGAKAALTAAGYTDTNADGWRNLKGGGGNIELNIQVPSGWSDWEAARDMIAKDAEDVGVKVTKLVGDFNKYQGDRNTGAFDLVIDNTYQLSDNPWTYYNGNFNLPIITTGTGQTFANFQRYDNNTAWNLVQDMDKTPPSNQAKRKQLSNQLQDILVEDVPNIPLWYNGVWAQTQSKHWTNWPADGTSRQYIPCMWRGYLQMTGIDTITHVKHA